jgi:hypothetical protein
MTALTAVALVTGIALTAPPRSGGSPAARPAPACPGQRRHPRPERDGRGQHGGVVHDSAAPWCSATKGSGPAQGQPADRPRPATGSHGYVPRCYQVIVSPAARAYRLEQEVLRVICVKRDPLSSCRPGPRRRLARSRVEVACGCTSRPSPFRTPCRERGASASAPPVTERTSRPAPPCGTSATHTRLRRPSARRPAEPHALAAGRHWPKPRRAPLLLPPGQRDPRGWLTAAGRVLRAPA